VGVVGFAHMHVNELVERVAATGRCDFVGVADTVPATPSLTTVEGSRRANLERALGAPGGPRRFEEWRGLLEEKLDLIRALDTQILTSTELAQEMEKASMLLSDKAYCRIRATSLSVVRRNSLFQLPAALFSTFCH
jgi:hypothetical protein